MGVRNPIGSHVTVGKGLVAGALGSAEAIGAEALQVFVGNLAYSITDEGLKTFFAPFQSDMCVATVVPCVATQTNRL